MCLQTYNYLKWQPHEWDSIVRIAKDGDDDDNDDDEKKKNSTINEWQYQQWPPAMNDNYNAMSCHEEHVLACRIRMEMEWADTQPRE